MDNQHIHPYACFFNNDIPQIHASLAVYEDEGGITAHILMRRAN